MNNGKREHFFIAALLLIYLVSAKPLYNQFFLRDGKPVQRNASLPAPASAQIEAAPVGQAAPVKQAAYIFRLSHLRSVRHNGQDLYELRGFAFPTADPLMKNRIRIVLSGPGGNRLYATAPATVASMLKSFKYPQAVSEQAEFSVLIAKQSLPPGSYQVGILLEEEAGARRAYLLTSSHIEKTPNRIRYRVVN